jgi:hypothetical protein
MMTVTVGKNGKHYANGRCVPRLVHTCRGPMTRREIAAVAGIPLNTVHSRIRLKIDGEELFAPSGIKRRKGGRTGPLKMRTESRYVETWAQRKARKKMANA